MVACGSLVSAAQSRCGARMAISCSVCDWILLEPMVFLIPNYSHAGYVAETATFVEEAAEDENDLVVAEAHKLKAAVESSGGDIDIA